MLQGMAGFVDNQYRMGRGVIYPRIALAYGYSPSERQVLLPLADGEVRLSRQARKEKTGEKQGQVCQFIHAKI
jgi:hypothetical protein